MGNAHATHRVWILVGLTLEVAVAGCGAGDGRAGKRDSASDGGPNHGGDEDAGRPPLPEANVVFVTSTLQAAGMLGGLEGADALCTELAS